MTNFEKLKQELAIADLFWIFACEDCPARSFCKTHVGSCRDNFEKWANMEEWSEEDDKV